MGELGESAVPDEVGPGVACVADKGAAVVPMPASSSSREAFWKTKRLALMSARFKNFSSSPGRHWAYCSWKLCSMTSQALTEASRPPRAPPMPSHTRPQAASLFSSPAR